MINFLKRVLAEEPGHYFERVKWYVIAPAICIFGGLNISLNVRLSGDLGYVYAGVVVFQVLVELVLLHYTDLPDEKLARKIGRRELCIGGLMIINFFLLFISIRHYEALQRADAAFAAEVKEYNAQVAEVEKLKVQRVEAEIEREKAATARAAQETETARLNADAAFWGNKRHSSAPIAGSSTPASGREGKEDAPAATIQKPVGPSMTAAYFLGLIEIVVGIFTGIECVWSWWALTATLRQGAIRINAEYRRKKAERQAEIEKENSFARRAGSGSTLFAPQSEVAKPLPAMNGTANAQNFGTPNAYHAIPTHASTVPTEIEPEALPFSDGEDPEVVQNEFDQFDEIDAEKLGEIEEEPGQMQNAPAQVQQNPAPENQAQEIPAPWMGVGFSLKLDRRKAGGIYNVKRVIPGNRKGLWLCDLRVEEIYTLQEGTPEYIERYLIEKIEARVDAKDKQKAIAAVKLKLK